MPDPDINLFRPGRPGIRKVLGDLEAEVMEIMWARPSGLATTVRGVFEALSRRRQIAYTTVMTTMARLARKNLLRVRKQGTAYAYVPTLTHDEFVFRIMGRVLADLVVGLSEHTVGRLKGRVDPKAVARARRLLDEIARRRAVEERE
ncbi:MAG: BlaI/MecI/CopY family transcriptional regulator [Armatimonadota bacterium]